MRLKLSTFNKGVHPQDFKELTNHKPVETLPIPTQVFIPLQQHIGAPCEPLVKKGATVKTGQVIGRSGSFVSSPIHSSVTGKVKAIGKFPHPMGSKVEMIHIQRTEEDDDWELLTVPADWRSATVEELRTLIRDAGIVGLGGAAFPTHVKLSPPPDKPIDSFILNGCECEPYLTADHRAMVEYTDKVLVGMDIIMKILGTEAGYIGIENNKPDAIELMKKRVSEMGLKFQVVPLQVKYPQGAEKMLIDAVLHRKVPAGGLPMDVGTVVNNIGTAMAVAEAVLDGRPLTHRIVTVTGRGVKEPRNLDVRLGTPFQLLVDFCGGITDDTVNVYNGGPMMGITQWNLSVPVIKATSGIICEKQSGDPVQQYPCIHCGNCISVCPMFLVPTRLARLSEMAMFEEADSYGILNCVECGSCAFECPAHIPLVQWIRIGKVRVGEMKRKKVS